MSASEIFLPAPPLSAKTNIAFLQYKTFRERFWAGIIDGFVLIPAVIAVIEVSHLLHSPWAYASREILLNFLAAIYSVTLHTRYGQTVGKKAMGIKVFDISETRLPSLWQSLLRDIGPLVVAICASVYLIYRVYTHQSIATSAVSKGLPYMIISGVDTVWFWLELITMFFSQKRRALHDLIAGTVVRLD